VVPRDRSRAARTPPASTSLSCTTSAHGTEIPIDSPRLRELAIEPNARLSRRFVERMVLVILAWILASASLWLHVRRRARKLAIS
jgi:hypothetical protein